MNSQSSLVKQLVARVSVTKSAAPKAAEGQPQSKTCRNLHGARSREASWTAAVLLPLLSRRLSATDSFNHTLRQTLDANLGFRPSDFFRVSDFVSYGRNSPRPSLYKAG